MKGEDFHHCTRTSIMRKMISRVESQQNYRSRALWSNDPLRLIERQVTEETSFAIATDALCQKTDETDR